MATAFKISPYNHLQDWGAMEDWAAGDAVAPTGWTLAGGGSVAKESTIKKFGLYSAKVTSDADGNNFSRAIHLAKGLTYWQGRTGTFGAHVYSADATTVRIKINDGVGNTLSAYHTGGGGWELLTVTHLINVAATGVTLSIENEGNVKVVYCDGAVFCEGEKLFTTFGTNIDVVSWQPQINVKAEEYKVAQRKGTLIPKYEIEKKGLKITGQVVGSDAVSSRTHLDEFIAGLMPINEKEKGDLYLFDDRVLEVFPGGVNWNYVKSMQYIQYSAQFIAGEPTSRYFGKLRALGVIAATYSTIPLAYKGNAASLPVISIIADQGNVVSTCQLQNLTTGQSFSYLGTIPENYTLEVDCFLATVTNSGNNAIGDFGGDYLGVVRGTNTFRFYGNNCTINIDYYDRWYS